MNADIRSLIHRTSVVSASLGVLLSPIPFLDELALFPVYGVMSSRIARRHAIAFREMRWNPILKSTAVGLLARAVVHLTFFYVPGVAAVGSAATAAALTEILGQYVDELCARPDAGAALTVREVMTLLKERATARLA